MDARIQKQVERAVRRSLEDLGVSPDWLNQKQVPLLDLITGDDISFVFVPNTEKALNLRTPLDAWNEVITV